MSSTGQRPRLETVSRSRLVEQIVEQITEQILSGEIAAGTPLGQEQLSAELGVSRTPLREALRVLKSRGFVTSGAANGSLSVVSLTRERAADMYEARSMVDGFAARLAAERATDEQIAGLEDLAEAVRSASRPFHPKRYLEVHAEFHLSVLRVAGNETLMTFEPIVQITARLLFAQLNRNRERTIASAGEHLEICKAIRARDPARAERLSREHVQNAIAAWRADGRS
ncbi:GntR family transcriptional regulator [Conexibacter sp. CPCC 206217]|uniref:GntR family transcriptional regulator n=1 Tax=Conexibacter sp. CPCC 206217 TaxID=3064574 RepID=UPI0027222ACC|nr:GntR family transcriptional regulator [Conexibacter sp. CPCC 206217]MDO8210112.1 GntR family transcriptional regulator [Conexibacter sp. CPCC 206217]